MILTEKALSYVDRTSRSSDAQHRGSADQMVAQPASAWVPVLNLAAHIVLQNGGDELRAVDDHPFVREA